jgi:hypothetical protein
MLPPSYTFTYDKENDQANVWSIASNRFVSKWVNERGYTRVTVDLNKRRKKFLLHRLIAFYLIPNPQNLTLVDHIDGDKSNNRLSNLRWVTKSSNNHNQKKAKGYSWHKQKKKWCAQIRVNDKQLHLGSFNTESEARNAYLAGSALYYPGIKPECLTGSLAE